MRDFESPQWLRELSAGMAAGNDAAWIRFHEHYGPRLFRVLLAMSHGDPHLASDALQQVYLRIARYVKTCESAPAWDAWLRKIARSALSDCRRREFRFRDLLKRRSEEPDTLLSDSEMHEETALYTRLDDALHVLSPEAKDLLELKYYHQQPVRTIAERLGLTEKAVESRLTRARAELKKALGEALARCQHE